MDIQKQYRPIKDGFKKENYKTTTVQTVITDDSRVDNLPGQRRDRNGRQIPLTITSPEGEGNFPTIILSHGIGGSSIEGKRAMEHHAKEWASKGYVVIEPTHLGSDYSTGKKLKSLGKLSQYVNKNPETWTDRPNDIRYIIDNLNTIASTVPGLSGKMDTEHIGVAGHSMGAYTALAVAGAKIDLPDGTQDATFADPRVDAVLAMSPPGPGALGTDADSWSEIKTPTMTISGTEDVAPGTKDPAERQVPYQNMPAGDKYNLLLPGEHDAFGQAYESNPFTTEVVSKATNAFWDAELKNSVKDKALLKSDRLEKKYSSQGFIQADSK